MLKFEHPWLAIVVGHWPSMIFLPTIMLIVVTLALVTRWWDRKDAEVARELTDRAHYGAAGAKPAR